MTAVRRELQPEPTATMGLDLAAVVEQLRSGRRIRRQLRPWGRLFIDHPAPFLCVCRRPPGSSDAATEALVTGEASYLLAPGDPAHARGVTALVRAVAGALAEDFGGCLVLEVWRTPDQAATDAPLFRMVRRPGTVSMSTIDMFEGALSQIALPEFRTRVVVETRSNVAAPTLPSLLGLRDIDQPGWLALGLEIRPVYRDPAGGAGYPIVHRRLRRGLSRALKQVAFEFTTRHTTDAPAHFQAMGRRTFVKAVWEVDKALAEVSSQFDLLLLTTPRNVDEAWAQFRAARYGEAPQFSYPPRPFDPALLKRRLFRIPIERIEDPTLADLLRQQQDELDRKITMISDRNTPRFLYEGLQLFGPVTDELLHQANQLLDIIPSRARESSGKGQVDTSAFVALAEEELSYLRRSVPALSAKVQVRDDIASLMVSRGNLLVPSGFTVAASRVEALLQHEIGTHVVTYHNGAAQQFRQLRNGLPGYEELQEGLAVLAEYLAGGLSRPRLRVLAARVVAVRRMTDGASFVDVFRELDRAYDFASRVAFTITMRVFRSGGQPKDAVYLRGLIRLLEYVKQGGTLDPLFVGKFSFQHLPILRELERRRVLVPPLLTPRYLTQPETAARLDRLREGVGLIELVRTKPRRAQ